MTRTVLTVTLLMVIVGQGTAADEPINRLPVEQREAYAEQGLEFAQCAGLFFAEADVGREAGYHPDNVELAEGQGRGAQLVAEMLFALAMSDPSEARPYARDRVESNRGAWRTVIRGGGSDHMIRVAKRCLELLTFQERLINELRKKALTR